MLKEASRSKGVKWDNLCFAQEWWVAVEGKSEFKTHEEIVKKFACKFDPKLLAENNFNEEMIKKAEAEYQKTVNVRYSQLLDNLIRKTNS